MCVCAPSLVVLGGIDVGGFINRAVAVIELFFLSIVNLKLLKQNKYRQLSVMHFKTIALVRPLPPTNMYKRKNNTF